MKRIVIVALLILCAAATRLLPHPPNFTPLAAMALAGGVYLDRRYALLVPIGAMFLSDLFIGFHALVPFVYGSFLPIGMIGLWLRPRRKPGFVFAAALASSVIFYVVSNFGVWVMSESFYPATLDGLGACYVAAIPFFRNALLGDLVYTGALFGLMELLERVAARNPEVRSG